MGKKVIAIAIDMLSIVMILACLNTEITQANPMGPTKVPNPTIVIESDGSVYPSTTLLAKSGNIYTLTSDCSSYVFEIYCSNIIFDGAGRTLDISNLGPDTGIYLPDVSNVTIRNIWIKSNYICVSINGASNCVIANSTLTGCHGVHIEYSERIEVTGCVMNCSDDGVCSPITGNSLIITRNNITGGASYGILIDNSNSLIMENNLMGNAIGLKTYPDAINNTVVLNNFLSNTRQTYLSPALTLYGAPTAYNQNFWDNGTAGNYWSDYVDRYPNSTTLDNVGVFDTPYIVEANNIDHCPLLIPFNIGSIGSPLPSQIASEPVISPTPTLSFTSSQSPTPNLTAIITVAPTLTPSLSPTQQPTIEPSSTPNNTQRNTTELLITVGLVVVIVAVAAGLIVYFRKKRG